MFPAILFVAMVFLLFCSCINTSTSIPQEVVEGDVLGATENQEIVGDQDQVSSLVLDSESVDGNSDNPISSENDISIGQLSGMDGHSGEQNLENDVLVANELSIGNDLDPANFNEPYETLYSETEITCNEEIAEAKKDLSTSRYLSVPEETDFEFSTVVPTKPVGLVPSAESFVNDWEANQLKKDLAIDQSSEKYEINGIDTNLEVVANEKSSVSEVAMDENPDSSHAIGIETNRASANSRISQASTEVAPILSDSDNDLPEVSPAVSSDEEAVSKNDIQESSSATVVVLVIIVLTIVYFRRKKNRRRKKQLLHNNKNLGKSRGYSTSLHYPDENLESAVDTSAVERNMDDLDMFTIHVDGNVPQEQKYKIPRISKANADIVGMIRWIPPGKLVEFNGQRIDCGMFYIGYNRRGPCDPSYIDTSKPVSKFDNYHFDSMGYWPSYSTASSDARGAYLAWLAHGKDDPSAAIGNVFLYFYGLERRILVDYPKGIVNEEEVRQIRQEVERLLAVYGEQSGSVRKYFTGFLDYLFCFEVGERKLYLEPLPAFDGAADIPFYLKVLLGQCAIDGIPMKAEIALLWILYDPLFSKKTPVKRCVREFKQLFKLRYCDLYGEGIRLPRNKTPLKVSYQPASSNFLDVSLDTNIQMDLPDVTKLASLRKKLQGLLDTCTSDLDRYSRFVGKNNSMQDCKKSLTLLPVELIVSDKEEILEELHQSVLGKDHVLMSIQDALQKVLEEEKISRESLQILAKTLENKNIGMEPDVLSYPYDLSPEDSVLLFALGKDIPGKRLDEGYWMNVMLVELAEAVARADGKVEEKEIESILENINAMHGISDYQKMRLCKHLEFLRHAPLRDSFIKKKLKALPASDVAKLLTAVNPVVLADGVIDSSEVQYLERIYKYLDIDTSQLYHHIQNPSGFGMNGSSKPSGDIDFDRVAKLKEESAEVSSILAEIFIDEDTGDAAEMLSQDDEENGKQNPLNLDDSQIIFLTALLSKSVWQKTELQSIADEHRLMLDGTLELINENALDQYGVPVTEGDDVIEVSKEYLGRTTW
jgi:uncharacterized tellurite resistance protein B-like protein